MHLVKVGENSLATKRTSSLALRLALLNKLCIALNAVLGLMALSTSHTIPAKRFLTDTTHRLTILVLAADLQVGANIVLITIHHCTPLLLCSLDTLLDSVGDLVGFTAQGTTSGALGSTLFDVLGVAVEGFLFRVAHGARETASTEILLAQISDDFAIADALHGELGADVVVVIRRVVEPVGQS